MAYDEDKQDRHASKDKEIKAAEKANKYQERTDPGADNDGFLGMDDLDRLRRERLKHQTR